MRIVRFKIKRALLIFSLSVWGKQWVFRDCSGLKALFAGKAHSSEYGSH